MSETNNSIKNKQHKINTFGKIITDNFMSYASTKTDIPISSNTGIFNFIDDYMGDKSIANTKLLVKKNTVRWDTSVTGYIPSTHTTNTFTKEFKLKDVSDSSGLSKIPTVQAVEDRIYTVIDPFKDGKFRLENKYIGVLTEKTRKNKDGITRILQNNKKIAGKLLRQIKNQNISLKTSLTDTTTPLAETELVISDPNSDNTFKFTKDLFPDDPLSAISLSVDVPCIISQNLSSTGNPVFNTVTVNDTLTITQAGGLHLKNDSIKLSSGPELIIGSNNISGKITFNSDNIQGICTFIPVSGSVDSLIPTQAAAKNFIDSIGTQGPQGAYGISNTGLYGYQGSQGISFIGSQGWRGVQGPDGISIIGPTGPQGVSGTVFDRGLRGIQGPQGLIGITGQQGPQGNIGPRGSFGPVGYIGFQGITGIQGVQGLTGYKGFIGAQGSQGTVGAQGSIGLRGAQGPSGIGNRGPQGFQGVQGSGGVQGSQGFQGFAGVTGSIGVQGNQGTGLNGFIGPQGEKGIQGVQGGLGPRGVQGQTGLQGYQGVQGGSTIGFQGSQGFQGIIGTSYSGRDLGSVTFNYVGATTTETFTFYPLYGTIGSDSIDNTSKYATSRIQFDYTPTVGIAPSTGYFITDIIDQSHGITPDGTISTLAYCGKTDGTTINYDTCYVKLFPATGGSKISIERYDTSTNTATYFTTPASGERFIFDTIYVPYAKI